MTYQPTTAAERATTNLRLLRDQKLAADRAARTARARLVHHARHAHAEGVPIEHIATTCGVTRAAVYKWLRGC